MRDANPYKSPGARSPSEDGGRSQLLRRIFLAAFWMIVCLMGLAAVHSVKNVDEGSVAWLGLAAIWILARGAAVIAVGALFGRAKLAAALAIPIVVWMGYEYLGDGFLYWWSLQ